MRNSETCLITPHGRTRRLSTALSDAILSGCVPLIVHDDSAVLSTFSIGKLLVNPARAALRNAKTLYSSKKKASYSLKRENDLARREASVWNDKWQRAALWTPYSKVYVDAFGTIETRRFDLPKPIETNLNFGSDDEKETKSLLCVVLIYTTTVK